MNTEINIGIDTSQSQLDIFVRALDVFFSVENTPQGVIKAVKQLRSYNPERVLIEATGRLEMTFVCAAHKAGKDRITVLPDNLVEEINHQLVCIKRLHEGDLSMGMGYAKLPYALHRKLGKSSRRFYWQYIFPGMKYSEDPRQKNIKYRWHIHPATIRQALTYACS